MLTALWLATSAASLSSGLAADAPYSSARLLAQAELPGPTVDRAALAAERTRLLDTRPGLGMPITMMSIGGGLSFIFIAATASLANNSSYYYSTPTEIYAVLGVLIAGALGMVAIGIVSLVFRIPQRNEIDARLKVIDQKIGPAGPERSAPPEDYPVPPPPPGPPPPPPGPDQGPPGPPPPPPPPLALFSF
ncbi:MAG: hypothetical protein H6Q89_4062 [Myxococcaceae bacterium]|nr:hypothetical protein [Myxococcaceae bacterium]